MYTGNLLLSLCKKCPYLELFWSAFFLHFPTFGLNTEYEAWNYKKNKHKKIKAYRKSFYKEPTVKRCLLILELKSLGS